MKHCNNCGFNNRDESIRCIKCNYILEPVLSEGKPGSGYVSGKPQQVQKTKASIQVTTPAWDATKETVTQTHETCPACSYPVRLGESICPNCNQALKPQIPPKTESNPVATDTNKTVRRIIPTPKSGCRLVALSVDAEHELRSISLDGEQIVLNRELLDTGNNSISRTGHASLSYQSGEWWIENLSALKSTFIQVNEPIRLKEGDIILIGDRLFRFKMD